MTDSDPREVIPGGLHRPPRWKHLVPIARFLIQERGHLPLHEPARWGFTSSQVGVICHLSRRITDEDWDALRRRFVLPPNIGYREGLIRDNDNGVDFFGWDELIGLSGVESIEVWEAEERQLRRTYGRPGLGEWTA